MHLQSSRLLCKEAVGIEPRQKDVTEDTAHPRLHKFEGLACDHRRIDEIESERVGPVCIDDKSRIRIVFETLGHFFAVRGEDETIHNEVIEGGFVK